MLSVQEALALVVEHAGQQPAVETPLEKSFGLLLAEDVTSDVDSPPFTKSMMDGYAVLAADIKDGQGEVVKVGEIAAGQVPSQKLEAGQTIQIMTGAPVPEGAEAVIMVENSQVVAETSSLEEVIELKDSNFKPGQNIMPKGRELSKGEIVLKTGHRIGAPEVGLLATVGCVSPKVFQRPTLAVLSTGDEIVPPSQKPGPGQIRNSNESTVVALAQAAGINYKRLGVAKDDEADLAEKIKVGLNSDVLILSGGVSAGKRDLVPKVLEQLGVKQVFHKARFKPGKPIWFGTHENGLVFGLPGNPVSVLACFEVFVKTALKKRMGFENPLPQLEEASLREDFKYSTRRPTYHPAKLRTEGGKLTIQPVSWYGSPDLRALNAANSLVVLPSGDGPYNAGDSLQVLSFRQGLL